MAEAHLEVLSLEECLEHLRVHTVGRVAVVEHELGTRRFGHPTVICGGARPR